MSRIWKREVYEMEFLVLSCLAVIAAVLIFWIVVYPVLLMAGVVISVGLGVITALSNQDKKRYT